MSGFSTRWATWVDGGVYGTLFSWSCGCQHCERERLERTSFDRPASHRTCTTLRMQPCRGRCVSSEAHQELVESEPPSVEALAQRYGYTHLRLAQYPPRPFFRFLCGSRTGMRVHLRLAFSRVKIRSMCEGPGTRARGSKDERGSRATPASVAVTGSVMNTHMQNAYAQLECSRSGAYASSSG